MGSVLGARGFRLSDLRRRGRRSGAGPSRNRTARELPARAVGGSWAHGGPAPPRSRGLLRAAPVADALFPLLTATLLRLRRRLHGRRQRDGPRVSARTGRLARSTADRGPARAAPWTRRGPARL